MLNPDFAEFQRLRADLLLNCPELLDCTETRMARSLARWTAEEHQLALPAQGYRCHVAEAWLQYFGLPEAWKPRALVTQGVRASLKVLFEEAAMRGIRVAIPSDVYPVYWQIALEAKCSAERLVAYDTVPSSHLFDAHGEVCASLEDVDWVLLASPCKPSGEALSAHQACSLQSWASIKPQRRILVDAVYTFEARLPGPVLNLLSGEKTILLHSLSKGWAAPLKAGIALVPQADVEALTAPVRALKVDKAGLRLAQGLLESDAHRPVFLSEVLTRARKSLRNALENRGVSTAMLRILSAPDRPVPGQYLIALPMSWEQFRHDHQVLALPVSVFGSSLSNTTVVSSLPFV